GSAGCQTCGRHDSVPGVASKPGGTWRTPMNRELFEPPALVRPAEDLAVLAEQINAAHQAGEGATRKGLEHFRAAGDRLIKAKAQLKEDVGHGQWLKWIKKNLKFDRRTATNYMRIADKWETVSHSDNLRDALRLLTEDAPDDEASDDPPPPDYV